MKLLDDEKFLNKEVYNALCDMGVPKDNAQTLAAEAARFDRRFDSLEQSMLAMQTGLRHEMSKLKTEMKEDNRKFREQMQEDNRKFREEMKGEMSELKTELKTSTTEWKTNMRWMFGISMVILGSLAALLLIQSFS